MLGLRAENDRQFSDIARIQNSFRKTSKFANALRGRFFVSGVSGGFQKLDKDGKEVAVKPPKQPKYNVQPVIEKNQRAELMREAQKLIELEEKLAEIQRLKEARRERDRQRRKRRLEYNSAFTIQSMFRKFRRRKCGNAVAVILNFLRVMAAKQAICTAVWAISVLRRFASSSSVRWLEKQRYRKRVRQAAEETWLLVREAACMLTAARRSVAHECVSDSITIALCNVGNKLISERQAIDLKASKKSLKGIVKSPKFRSLSIANSFLQFFLTEFNTDADDASQYSIEELSMISNQMTELHGQLHDPSHGRSDSDHPPDMPQLRRVNSRYWNIENSNGKPKKKQYNLDDTKVKAILLKHIKTMARVEAERIRRVQMLETAAQEKSHKSAHDLEEEKKALARKKKEDFLKRVEEEQKNKSELMNRLRKARIAREAELARERDEQQRMLAQDVRLHELAAQESERRRKEALRKQRAIAENTKLMQQLQLQRQQKLMEGERPVVSSKRPPVPKIANVNRASKPEVIEDAEPARKQLSGEELTACREALLRRLREQERRRAAERRAAEQEEERRKEKVAQVLLAHRLALEEAKDEKRRQQQLKRQQAQERKNAAQSEWEPPQSLRDEAVDSEVAVPSSREAARSDCSEDRGMENAPVGRAISSTEHDPQAAYEQDDGLPAEDVLHAISSAREEYDEPMDDFAFDDFMKSGLQVIYSNPAPPPPKGHAGNNRSTAAAAGGASKKGAGEDKLGKRKLHAKLKEKVAAGKAKADSKRKVQSMVKKLPEALKNTPYFATYVKLTEAGLNSLHDLTKKEFLDLADPAHHRAPFAGAEVSIHAHPAAQHPTESHPAASRYKREEMEEEDAGEDMDVDCNEDLLAMIDRARKSLQPAATDEPEAKEETLEAATNAVRDEEGQETAQDAGNAPAVALTESSSATETTTPATAAAITTTTPAPAPLTLDRVLNFHQYRAPPSLPQPPSVTHIPLLASWQGSHPPQAHLQPKEQPSQRKAAKAKAATSSLPTKKAGPATHSHTTAGSTSNHHAKDTSTRRLRPNEAQKNVRGGGGRRNFRTEDDDEQEEEEDEEEEEEEGEDGEGHRQENTGKKQISGPLPPHLRGKGQGKGKKASGARSLTGSTAAIPTKTDSNKIRQKLVRFHDYEARLQADYDALRLQFQSKLQQAAMQFTLPTEETDAVAPSDGRRDVHADSPSRPGVDGEEVEQRGTVLQQYLSRSMEISTKDICSVLFQGGGDEEEEGEDDEGSVEARQEAVRARIARIAPRGAGQNNGRYDEEGAEEGEGEEEGGEEDEEEGAWQEAFRRSRAADSLVNDDFCNSMLLSLGAKAMRS